MFGVGLPSTPQIVDALRFTVEGATFEPRLVLDGSASVTWTAPTGAQSGASPNFNFGTVATRTVTMRTAPAGAITTLNLGYDQGDSGPATIALRPQQNVSGIRGLQNLRDLRYFAASYCPITSLDFHGLESLQQIECYLSQQLAEVNLRGCVDLRRVCFEDANLTELDLRDQSALEDLRGALNALSSIVWPANGMPNLWHMCLRDGGPIGALLPNFALYPALREIWLWNCGMAGAFVPWCAASADLRLNDNALTSLDLTHCSSVNVLQCWSNDLVSVNWGATTGFTQVILTDNNLSQAQVDAALIHVRDHGATIVSVQLGGGGMAVPSAAGLSARDSIVARGGTVQVNS